MNKTIKVIPKFKNEDQEREFWANHDATDYFDMKKAFRAKFPNLKPSNQLISLRLPTSLLETIKKEAHKRDMPYQSYLKAKLYEVFIETHPVT